MITIEPVVPGHRPNLHKSTHKSFCDNPKSELRLRRSKETYRAFREFPVILNFKPNQKHSHLIMEGGQLTI